MDLGCQIFDNSHSQATQSLLDLAQNQYRPQHMKHGSLLNQHFSSDYAVLDLSLALKDKQAIYDELLAAEKNQKTVKNLADYFINRFGQTVGKQVIKAAEKKLHARLESLDICASKVTFLDRIKLFNDEISLKYKNSSAFLDARLAHYNPDNPSQYYANTDFNFRNFYPSTNKGLKQFMINAQNHLQDMGVNLQMQSEITELSDKYLIYANSQTQKQTKIEFKNLLWAGELSALEQLTFGTSQFKSLIFSMPMVLVYFEICSEQTTEYDYVHNYNQDDFTFRASNMGRYSHQFDNGKTFICCEIPTSINSDIWNKTEKYLPQMLEEAVRMNICHSADYLDHKIIKAPVTYKIPKQGFSNAFTQFHTKLKQYYPNIELIDPIATSFVDILTATSD